MAEARAEQDQMDASAAGNRAAGSALCTVSGAGQSRRAAGDLPRWAGTFVPWWTLSPGFPSAFTPSCSRAFSSVRCSY